MKQRIASLDFIRLFAILTVILVHCVEQNYPMNAEILNSYSVASQVIATTLFCIGRLGVPLFLFLTGYLLLGKPYSEQQVIGFYTKKVLPLILTTEIWIVVYYFVRLWAYDESFDGIFLLRYCLFLQYDGIMPHLWYMPMIIGMYLFIPFIANALQAVNDKYIMIVACVASVYCFLIPTLSNFTQLFAGFPIGSGMDVSFSGGAYGIMIVIGYLMRSTALEKSKLPIRILVFLGAMGLCVTQQLFLYAHYYSANTWYNSVTLLISAIALFQIGLTIFNERNCLPAVSILAQNAFAIYLVHYIYIIIFKKMLLNGGKHIMGVLFMYGFSLVLSVITVLLVRKSKRLSKILFFN